MRKAARGLAPQEVGPETLAVGDRVRIAGEPHDVIAKNPDGSVRLKDGVEVDTQPGEPVVIDAGSHQPDPVGSAVSAAVGEIKGQGVAPSVDRVLGIIRERLGEGAVRDKAMKELFGLTKLKGNIPAIRGQIEQALLRHGQGVRGIGWENVLSRLEHVEAGGTGRAGIAGKRYGKLEETTHPLGAMTEPIRDASGVMSGGQRLTALGRAALDAMRAHVTHVADAVAAGKGNEHVQALVERITELRARAAMAKRAGRHRPPDIYRELTQKEEILRRMGVVPEDDVAMRAAAAAQASRAEVDRAFGTNGSDLRTKPLPVPSPRELFAPEVADVVERFLGIEAKTRAAETAKGVGTANITETTERGLGYFPRIMGDARSTIGNVMRSQGKEWEKDWNRTIQGLDQPLPGSAAAHRKFDPHAELIAAIQRENVARAKRGLAAIAEPSRDDDLARSIASILDQHPELSPSHRHQLQRTFLRESMLHEVNGLAEHTGIGFENDPVKVWLKRRYASHFAQAGADFLQAVLKDAERSGLAVPLAGKGPTPDGFSRIVDRRFGAVAGNWAFADELVKEFKRFQGTTEKPHLILRAWDWASSQWKTGVLAAFPYTTTNLMSGVFQANQQEAFSHKAWTGARRWMEDYHGGKNLAAPLSRYVPGLPSQYAKLTVQEFYDALSIEHGALGKGLHGVEMESAVRDGMRTEWGVAQALKDSVRDDGFWPKVMRAGIGVGRNDAGQMRFKLGDAAYFKAFRAINVGVEDWMKSGFILERLRRGDDLAEAVQKARLSLNQSADLTDFEKATFRRILPFYGWMKGNAVLQFMMAIDRPTIIGLVPKIRGDLESSFAGDETLPPSLRPRHVAGELGAQVSGGANPNFVNLTRLFPVKEIGTTPLAGPVGMIRNAVDSAVQGLNPLAKTPLETSMNRDLFWDRPIVEYDGQQKRFLGFDVSPGTKRALAMLRPLNAAEQVSWRGVPSTGTDAAFTTGQALGFRTFGVDVKRQVLDAQRSIDQDMAAVMRDYSRARSNAEQARRDWRTDPDVQRMAEIYRALLEKRSSLPLKPIRDADRERLRTQRATRDELRDYARAG